MREPILRKIRLPILAAMICAEVAGIVHYRATGEFIQFLVFAVFGTTATAELFWRDEFQPMGVSPGVVAYCLLLFAPTTRFGHRLDKVDIGFDIVLGLFVFAFGVLSIASKRSANKKHLQSGSDKGRENQAADIWDIGPLGCIVFATVLLSEISGDIFFKERSFFWLVPAAPPFSWFLWQYVIYRKQQKQLNPTENLSIVQREAMKQKVSRAEETKGWSR